MIIQLELGKFWNFRKTQFSHSWKILISGKKIGKNGKFRSRKISNLSSEPTVKSLPSTYHNIGRVTGDHDPSLSNVRYNSDNGGLTGSFFGSDRFLITWWSSRKARSRFQSFEKRIWLIINSRFPFQVEQIQKLPIASPDF